MPVVRKESEILKDIKNNLSLFCREVIWVDRLQSGVAMIGPHFVRLCAKGTPDLYALVNNKGYGHVLSIECKTEKGKQSISQKQFEYGVKGIKNFHYLVARSVYEVIDYINKYIFLKNGDYHYGESVV